MEELAKRGIQIPQEISIAGFDDLMTARMTNPPLTTMRQPFREMGHRAVDLLLLQIKKDTEKANSQNETDGASVTEAESASASNPHIELFDTELIVRKSVGPPPTHSIILSH
jgi:DNA-binding LacI/PurR family transcriptional regulator